MAPRLRLSGHASRNARLKPGASSRMQRPSLCAASRSIRRALAGEFTDAKDTDAVRVALVRLFERFVVHRDIPSRAHAELIGEELWIEPVIREQAVEAYTENLTQILRREPLQQAGEKINDALARLK